MSDHQSDPSPPRLQDFFDVLLPGLDDPAPREVVGAACSHLLDDSHLLRQHPRSGPAPSRGEARFTGRGNQQVFLCYHCDLLSDANPPRLSPLGYTLDLTQWRALYRMHPKRLEYAGAPRPQPPQTPQGLAQFEHLATLYTPTSPAHGLLTLTPWKGDEDGALFLGLTRALDLVLLGPNHPTRIVCSIAAHTSALNQDHDWQEDAMLLASPSQRFVFVSARYGQFGALIDLAQDRLVRITDRGTYHISHCVMSALFFADPTSHSDYFICATDWNRLMLYDAETGAPLAERDTTSEGDERHPHDVDYFYSELVLMPDGHTVLSKGWVWQPMGVSYLFDAARWLHDSIWEPEEAMARATFSDLMYTEDWQRPHCFLDARSLCLWGAAEDYPLRGLSVVSVEDWEPLRFWGGDLDMGALIALDPSHVMVSSRVDGAHIWNIETGQIVGHLARWILCAAPTKRAREVVCVQEDGQYVLGRVVLHAGAP